MRWQRWNDQSHNKRIQQISTGVRGETRRGRQGDPLGNVQEISIRPYQQIVYAPVLENDSHKLL